MAQPSGSEGRMNKVYVNPNFQNEQKKPVVYFNPAFSSKSRIFVNPNFVSQTNTIENYETAQKAIARTKDVINAQISEPCSSQIPIVTQPLASTSRFSLTRHKKENDCTQVASKNYLSSQDIKPATLIKSKYCIKRCPDNTISITEPNAHLANQKKFQCESLMPFTKTRFKLTRSLENVVKPEIKSHLQIGMDEKTMKQSRLKYSLTSNKSYSTTQSRSKNRTYVKGNKKAAMLRQRSFSNLPRHSSGYQNPSMSKLKKNNIPCPLFSKFGQCLRKERGSCCFLHDKKHVRLCKKFLKGLCFNDNCLLSHALTTQKMPTCQFYLKGVCVRDDCPYLHVKLNDDAQICKDFMKGFCEKGENCLNRHVDVKKSLSTKRWVSKGNRKKAIKKAKDPVIEDDKNSLGKQPENERYYIDEAGTSREDIHQIKPSRCKLGSLPSFIKL